MTSDRLLGIYEYRKLSTHLSNFIFFISFWRSGESTELIPDRRHIWVEFVVSSRLAREFFSLSFSGFPLHKDQQLQIPIRPGSEDPHENQPILIWLPL